MAPMTDSLFPAPRAAATGGMPHVGTRPAAPAPEYVNVIRPAVYRYVGVEPGAELPAFAWPGGYPLVYQDADGLDLCAPCANKTAEYSADLVGAAVYYEGPALQCEGCQTMIEAAYGDPDAPEGTLQTFVL